jgi:D-tagatose-1,6-bisphosphate aldolase subunit GatZ/KbaZ
LEQKTARGQGASLKDLTEVPIPLTVLSQYTPDAYQAVRRGDVDNDPLAIALFKVDQVLATYSISTHE